MDNMEGWEQYADYFLNAAINKFTLHRYGLALATATIAVSMYHDTGNYREKYAATFCELLKKEIKFISQAREEGLPLTPENYAVMMREHSPHYAEYLEFALYFARFVVMREAGASKSEVLRALRDDTARERKDLEAVI